MTSECRHRRWPCRYCKTTVSHYSSQTNWELLTSHRAACYARRYQGGIPKGHRGCWHHLSQTPLETSYRSFHCVRTLDEHHLEGGVGIGQTACDD